jgi:hypothetical protein
MSGTYRASLSIKFAPVGDGPVRQDRWARVDLEDHFWLGRCTICNLVFDDTLVSRLHATIQREGDAYRLTDMQSMNGTWVNGREVRSAVLRPGDEIHMGNTHFVFSPERPHDTVFRDGTTRNTGSVSLTLRSFPSSLTAMPRPVQGSGNAARPKDAEELTKTMSFKAAEELPAGPVAPQTRGDPIPEADRAPSPDPVAPLDGSPLLETFLTIVIDRIVSELRAVLGVIHVPAVNGHPPLSIGRGWFEGKLDVRKVPAELAERINAAIPMPTTQKDGVYRETGDMMQWRGPALNQVIAEGQRLPPHGGSSWSATVPLPAVGRANTDRKPLRPLDSVAWIHVELDSVSPQGSYARILEVAGGTAAAMIRFIERR